MCNCIDELNAQIAPKNTRLSVAFQMNGKTSLIIATETITKKRGSRPLLALATYCPFCGEKADATPADGVGVRELAEAV